MKVFLTVDVECYRGNYLLEVHGSGKGLDYILNKFCEHGVKGTFFVEALGADRWGDGPLGRVCEMIRGQGHDLQLHIHPSVACLEGFHDIHDILKFHHADTQARLIERGISNLMRLGECEVTAFRAGDLAANADTLTAMSKVCLHLGSNRDLDCKSSIRTDLNHTFPVQNDLSLFRDQYDLPVSVLRSPIPWHDGAYRHMQITAMGLWEMCSGLRRMAVAGYKCATILMHPGEFFQLSKNGRTHWKNKNCNRLDGLLRFLASNPCFDVQVMKTGLLPSDESRNQLELVRGIKTFALLRFVEQGFARFRIR